MTDHDPLCPLDRNDLDANLCPYCPVIVKVRADERERIAHGDASDDVWTDGFDHGKRAGAAEERERIAQAIEAYATTMDERWGHVSPVPAVLFNAARIARESR